MATMLARVLKFNYNRNVVEGPKQKNIHVAC